MTEIFYIGYLGRLAVDNRINAFIYFAAIAACFVISYLIGSVDFSILVSKNIYHDDIRSYKAVSNSGTENMYRTFGAKAAAMTFIGDFFKAVIAVLGSRLLCGIDAACVACLACSLGNAFPCWFKFKGERFTAVLCASILCINPLTFILCVVIFALLLLITKYTTLGIIFSSFMCPIILYNVIKANSASGHGTFGIVFVFSACMLLIFLHRGSIKKIQNGTENRVVLSKRKGK